MHKGQIVYLMVRVDKLSIPKEKLEAHCLLSFYNRTHPAQNLEYRYQNYGNQKWLIFYQTVRGLENHIEFTPLDLHPKLLGALINMGAPEETQLEAEEVQNRVAIILRLDASWFFYGKQKDQSLENLLWIMKEARAFSILTYYALTLGALDKELVTLDNFSLRSLIGPGRTVWGLILNKKPPIDLRNFRKERRSPRD